MAVDNLKQTLINRAQQQQQTMPWTGTASPTNHPPAPTGLPAHTPNEKANVPPAWQRWLTSLHMQKAYANGWSPNPMLIRVLEGDKSNV